MLNALLEPFRMVVITTHHNPVWYRYDDLVEGWFWWESRF